MSAASPYPQKRRSSVACGEDEARIVCGRTIWQQARPLRRSSAVSSLPLRARRRRCSALKSIRVLSVAARKRLFENANPFSQIVDPSRHPLIDRVRPQKRRQCLPFVRSREPGAQAAAPHPQGFRNPSAFRPM
jgi:hypothetical protein